MLDLLLQAYEAYSKNKKTLIFNNGIFTSRKVLETLMKAGYPIKHLDNHTSNTERAEILKWFRRTKGAIITSVSILTTGFDEPSIQSIILNRATTSITLYHQMVGRGARRHNGKKTFSIIDLGNNTERFGQWDSNIDWKHVFDHPEVYHECISRSITNIHHIDSEVRAKFPNSLEVDFDVISAYKEAEARGEKSRNVIRDSIRQHALMCVDNSVHVSEAFDLCALLDKEIDYRIKIYAKCLGNVTKNYKHWLGEDYKYRLKNLTEKLMVKRSLLKVAV